MDISNLTLREKIGQLMMFGFDGITPSREIRKLIEEYQVGSIILFARNIGSATEVSELTTKLQTIAKKANHKLPLLISTDQENGIVRRLGIDTTTFPGSMLLGATQDTNSTYMVAKATAEELRALGINMNLAPVIDINNNSNNPVIGVRSFGEVAIDVANHGIYSIKGYLDAKVIPTVKHFPGHGDTDIDSHLALPTIQHSLERLENLELIPFKKTIEAGIEAVMVAHVYFPGIEDDLNKAVINMMNYAEVAIWEAVSMASLNPARLLGLDKEIGSIEIDKRANIVAVDHTGNVKKVWIDGIAQKI